MVNMLDGKAFAAKVRSDLRVEVEALKKERCITPGLAVILIGNDPAASVYVANKRRACEEIGIRAFDFDRPESITQIELLELIETLNCDPNVHGILVQLPLPKHIDETAVIEKIDPKKDVDGFHPYTIGKLVQRQPVLRPCTPYGVICLLQHYEISLRGLHAVVVGASSIVGRPMALELLLAGVTVTICHRMTRDLEKHVALADLLVVAVGKRDVVKSEWIKPASIVVDVGIHRLADGHLCGDLDYKTAAERAAWITPVPGGVGPMTVAMLMRNVVEVAKKT